MVSFLRGKRRKQVLKPGPPLVTSSVSGTPPRRPKFFAGAAGNNTSSNNAGNSSDSSGKMPRSSSFHTHSQPSIPAPPPSHALAPRRQTSDPTKFRTQQQLRPPQVIRTTTSRTTSSSTSSRSSPREVSKFPPTLSNAASTPQKLPNPRQLDYFCDEQLPPPSPQYASSTCSLAQVLDTSFESLLSSNTQQRNNRTGAGGTGWVASLVCLSLLERKTESSQDRLAAMLDRPSPQKLVQDSLHRHVSFWGKAHPDELFQPGMLQSTLKQYQHKLDESSLSGDRRAETLRKLVILSLALGLWKRALQYGSEALEYYRKHRRPQEASYCAMEVGLVQFGTFKMGKALKTWREAIQLSCLGECGYETVHVATLLSNIGVLHLETGDIPAAIRTLEESLEMQRYLLKQKLQTVDYSLFRLGITMANAAQALHKNQQHDSAMNLLDECKTVFASIQGTDTLQRLVREKVRAFRTLAKETAGEDGNDHENFADDSSLATEASVDTARSSVMFGNSDGIPDRRIAARLSRLPSDNHDFILLGPVYPEQTPEERIRQTVLTWFGRQIDDNMAPFISFEEHDQRNSSFQHESIPVDLDLEFVPNAELRLQEIYMQAMRHMDHHENEDALDLFRSALRSHRAKYGDKHHLVGTALHNIGTVHLFAKQYPEALVAFQEAVQNRRAALGPDHPDVQASLMKIGLIRYSASEFTLAQSIFLEIQDKFLEILGHGHPQMAKILNNLGVVACQIGEHASAYRLLEKAYQYQRRRTEDAEQEDDVIACAIANSLTNMAFVRFKQGNVLESLQLYETALEKLHKLRGADDPLVVLIARNIDHLVGRNVAMKVPSCQQCSGTEKDKSAVNTSLHDDDGIREDPPAGPHIACHLNNPMEMLEDFVEHLRRMKEYAAAVTQRN